MKSLFIHLIISIIAWGCLSPLRAQTTSVIVPSATSTGSLEKNMLFRANSRYQVTHQGPNIDISKLFDGAFSSTSTTTAVSPATPLVILIEGLPNIHVQKGGWVGWGTRYYEPIDFKIEGYNAYITNQWVTIADVTGNTQDYYMKKVPSGSFTKLRFTFYSANGTNNLLQLSELYFIHPEAAIAYDGLLVQYDKVGNVGIGTNSPSEKLSVNGNIRAKEIKVEAANWPDYVFEEDYQMPSLSETETFIKQHRHLPGMPNKDQVTEDGISLGEMNRKLLEKVEELTLLLIEKEKAEKEQNERIERLERDNTELRKHYLTEPKEN